jgi:hypothetical protein
MNLDLASLMGFINGVSEAGLSIRRRAGGSDSKLADQGSLRLLVVPILSAYARRMSVEEAALQQGLGAPYRLYMDRTKRLIPAVY